MRQLLLATHSRLLPPLGARLVLVCITLLAVGCGDTKDTGASGAVGVDTSKVGNDLVVVDSDAETDAAVGQDTSEPDTSGTVDSGSDDASDAGAPADAGPVCPSEPGCPCNAADDCDYPYCIDTPNGKRCAAKCVDFCPGDFKCATVPGAGGDVATICVPKSGKVCNPCKTNQECAALGSNPACVDHGDGGAFCGVDCKVDGDCTKGYECKDVKDVLGNATRQCVVANGGACSCSPAAIKAQLKTDCFVTAGSSKCSGERVCEAGGLSSCKAPDPAPEKCDGIDNDCDGQVDEATCDDSNTCTDDKCAGSEGCNHTNATGDCDADDSVCTKSDTCKDGNCSPGAKLNCDDTNPCTGDSCDPKTGCQHAPLSNQPCNADDNSCTQSDTCKAGQCKAGSLKSCDSGDACISGKCSIITGTCKYSPQIGLPCNDGNPCTTGETCISEACKGAATKCDDGNPCTTDTCDASKGGCLHKNNTDVCDDNNKCTTTDGCANGACAGLPVNATTTCDDSNPCTKDSCNAASGCQHAKLSSVTCDDGNTCTANDICDQGACKPGTNVCDCKKDADCGTQEDGNLCNGTLFCDTGSAPFKCKIKPSSVVKCDSSINGACKSNVCDPQSGKCGLDLKVVGTGCDADGSVCTKGDACDGKGKCAVGATVKCNDNNPCTDDSCDPKTGCVYTANTALCDADGSACTVGDVCSGKTCLPGKSKNCDDSEACTADSCNKLTGACVHKKLTVTCDDANACTKNDKCGVAKDGKFTCLSGAAVVCSDGNACTTDACDSTKGCTTKAVTDGTGCNDANACTDKDACKSGFCAGVPQAKNACDDKNSCTIDSCDSKSGCQHKAVTGASCDDGDQCTSGDTCAAGKCTAGTNLCACKKDADCAAQEDGNLCNGTLYCDKSGALYKCTIKPSTVVKCDTSADNFCSTTACVPKTGKCLVSTKSDATPCNADSSVCSVGDACKAGKCTAGVALKCDDLNPCTADTCDAKTGCKHLNQAGGCDADGDACTVNDVCTNGKCVVGKAKNCNDNEVCTAEKCDKKSGKCVYQQLVQSCDDKNICTVGDKCSKNAQGIWTCISGAAKACNDGNACTIDACDKTKTGGCTYTADTTTKHSCYTGPSGTQGKGICANGSQLCTAGGKLGPCQNQTTPAAKELCNGKDDTCNGVTDEGCAPTGFTARDGNVTVTGGTKTKVRASIGLSNSAGRASGKVGVNLGFYQWLTSVLGK